MASEEWRLRLEAANHFYAQRRRANWTAFWAWLTRGCDRLLRFEELAGARRTQARVDGGYRQVPINAIIGSVGRAQDFTRGFLPRTSVEAERWIRLYTALHSLAGFPEVELIQVGDQYIVEDGHHRISVARAAGLTDIAAHVTYIAGAPLQDCCVAC
jgi:hypothetical protein